MQLFIFYIKFCSSLLKLIFQTQTYLLGFEQESRNKTKLQFRFGARDPSVTSSENERGTEREGHENEGYEAA